LAALILPSDGTSRMPRDQDAASYSNHRPRPCAAGSPGNDPALFSGSCRDSRNSGPQALVPRPFRCSSCNFCLFRLVKELAIGSTDGFPPACAERESTHAFVYPTRWCGDSRPDARLGSDPVRQSQLPVTLQLTSLMLGPPTLTVNPFS
jgi:hypothetical protein